MSEVLDLGKQLFFLLTKQNIDGTREWSQVTKEQFVRAERRAGFHPKHGMSNSEPCTASFSSGSYNGRSVYLDYLSPGSYSWDPQFQEALDRAVYGDD
jgi:hypothetical protein